MSGESVYSLRGVVKSYSAGGTDFQLNIPELDVPRGSKLAVVGESGCGKSTLLELLTLLLRPTSCDEFRFSPGNGTDDQDVLQLWESTSTDHLADLRSRHVGYVVQSGGLLPYLTIRDNINLSRSLLEMPTENTAEELAGMLEIAAQLEKYPAELSTGQYQRATIARALAHRPGILVADEPTAAVDPINAERILQALTELVDQFGVTLLMATHNLRHIDTLGMEALQCSYESIDENRMVSTFARS